MPEKHLKRSTSLALREMKIKSILRFHLTPVQMARIIKQLTVHANEDVE